MQIDKSNKIVPIILAGGSGTRLWPLSTPEVPKQFAKLFGTDQETLFQKTLNRIKAISGIDNPIIVCNQKHINLVKDQCNQINVNSPTIILEPVGRNTAPAIAVAALQAMQLNPGQDITLLVLTSDHIIADLAAFHAAINCARDLATNNYLACFGIVPNFPETAYGYIKFGSEISDIAGAYNVDKFVEKPTAQIASEYLASKQYLWNSGMFMFKANIFIKELELYASDILVSCRETLSQSSFAENTLSLNPEIFAGCRSESIDYAIMEKTKFAATIPLDAGWCDLGSWAALWEFLGKDSKGNVTIGNEVKINNVENSYISSTGRKVVVLGINNCIVVETADAVLVLNKEQCQELKQVIETPGFK